MLLINASTVRTGGGLTILENFLTRLNSRTVYNTAFKIIVLLPSIDHDVAMKYPRLEIVTLPTFLSSSLASFAVTFSLPWWIKHRNIKTILNFGDLPIPSQAKQAMIIDWPYALYPDSPAWKKLSLSAYLMRKFKLILFRLMLRYVDVFLPQTRSAKHLLDKLYNIEEAIVIPNAVATDAEYKAKILPPLRSGEKLHLYYLTYYYPHKNIENLIYAVDIIKDEFDFDLVLTLDPKLKGTRQILKIIESKGLQSHVSNLGPIPYAKLKQFYCTVDVLVMPSLLESFSSSYIEAFKYNKPIVTSDLDFARSVCGNAALYVDPQDPAKIACGLREILSSHKLRQDLVQKGKERLLNMPDWDDVFEEYMAVIHSIDVNN